MADTGAPWNLPYPLSTDLVRDGAQAIEDLAEATATALSLAGNEGIGPNVVAAYSTTQLSTSSTSFVDATGLGVTITPSSVASKVLVVAALQLTNDFNGFAQSAFAQVVRDATSLGALGASNGFDSNQGAWNYVVAVYLDAPATDDPVDYKIQFRTSSGTARINRRPFDATAGASSSIVAIEVAP